MLGIYKVPKPKNEPVLDYKPGSWERDALKRALKELKETKIEVPLIIGGKPVKTNDTGEIRPPHERNHLLGRFHKAGENEVKRAIGNSLDTADGDWGEWDWSERAAVFLKAADLLAGPYRMRVNAATMLGQSKNVYQAEIDAACELIDFLRFNVYYMYLIYKEQVNSPKYQWNRLDYRPLEGFVFAVSPFNFTSINGNLPTAPAIMGNVVIFKPASTAVYSSYFFMKLLEEAGVPPGVINFLPGNGSTIGPIVIKDPHLAGVHFTGSTATFQQMWETVGKNITNYNTYPRLVGETGGKDFIFAHESADINALITAILRGAFEYQGQKCSAASRAYIPITIWEETKSKIISGVNSMSMGNVEDFRHFINAIIDKSAFDNVSGYINDTKASSEAEILVGGGVDDSIGYFIEPTVILTKDPKFRTMCEEIFGPVLSIYVYPANEYEKTLHLCNQTSEYGLTGSIFAQDRIAIQVASKILKNAAGNFYINDKPTGAVVGQQPFGGARKSGTNDKAGSWLNLLRWISPRTIKENLFPPTNYRYPFMDDL
ncbi:MAG: L-glutamate gamma-semialdehyde dehydrogenase [Candidatus Thorarchaeota archaeon]